MYVCVCVFDNLVSFFVWLDFQCGPLKEVRLVKKGMALLLEEVAAERRVVDSRNHLSFHLKRGGLLHMPLMNLTHCKF